MSAIVPKPYQASAGSDLLKIRYGKEIQTAFSGEWHDIYVSMLDSAVSESKFVPGMTLIHQMLIERVIFSWVRMHQLEHEALEAGTAPKLAIHSFWMDAYSRLNDELQKIGRLLLKDDTWRANFIARTMDIIVDTVEDRETLEAIHSGFRKMLIQGDGS